MDGEGGNRLAILLVEAPQLGTTLYKEAVTLYDVVEEFGASIPEGDGVPCGALLVAELFIDSEGEVGDGFAAGGVAKGADVADMTDSCDLMKH